MTQIEIVKGSERWKKLRYKALNDLYWFNAKILGLEDKIPMTLEAHYGMCRFAERKTGIPAIDGSRVQLIQIWRGAGKSALITHGRTVQRICSNRDIAIGIANERQENANAFLATIKQDFESNQLLQILFPEVLPDFAKTTWKSDRIVVNRTKPNPVNPTVLATGAGATVTGVHLDEWIVDDIISQDAAENARAGINTEIDKANRWIVRLQPLLSRPRHDPITFIGTPWWIEDSYHFIEKTFSNGEPLRQYMWSLELPNGKIQRILLEQAGDLAIFRHYPIDQETGQAVWPEGGLTLEALEGLRQTDPTFYAAQYLLKPGGGDASYFDEKWLEQRTFEWEGLKQIRWKDTDGKVHFDRLEEMGLIMSVDPAISKKTQADPSAIILTASNGKQHFLLEAWAKRVGATELAHKILELYDRYRPERIVIETVAYQEALVEILELLREKHNIHHRLPVFEYKTGSEDKKRVRILGLDTYFRTGLFYVNPRTQQDFLAEYRNFPNVKHDDLLDALSMQRSFWDRINAGIQSNNIYGSKWRDTQNRIAARHRRRRSRR